ncbi:adhesion G-protein coupled receptor G2-like [Fundulus diaphanus]
MKNMSSILELMGNASVAAIKMGNITGVISKLPQQNQTIMDFGFESSGDVQILKANNSVMTDIKQTIHFPKESSEVAVERNGTYAAVLLFPEIERLNKTSSFFNNEMLGIEMGAKISNLSETIDIHFSNVNTTEVNATCVSWDGTSKEGGKEKWIPDGCLTNEANGSITCQCSHLTFFAILMSSDEKISSSDLKILTQITKAGCGMSMFFLGVALFMHFLIRKNKASQAVKILMNLFVALFILNFCFLINESIANLKIFVACVAMAAVLHYSMLATFTWFFMQALHLYFNLHKISTDVKFYMHKICITGWGIPIVVVVGLLASRKYNYIEVSDDNGTSVNMCWIPDSAIHLGVNIGYYSIVFMFTVTVFIVTVVQITHFPSKKAKTQDSTKKRVFSLLGLFSLLGITWGCAFFSYGPLLLPSYYIFTIFNSFQGFFLFIYYYFSSRIIPEDTDKTKSSNQATQNVCTSPYG